MNDLKQKQIDWYTKSAEKGSYGDLVLLYEVDPNKAVEVMRGLPEEKQLTMRKKNARFGLLDWDYKSLEGDDYDGPSNE